MQSLCWGKEIQQPTGVATDGRLPVGFVVEFWGWWWDNRDVEREDLSTVDKFESREITSREHHGGEKQRY